MDIRCPTCGSAYAFDPARIPEAGFDLRCTVCSTVFRVAPEDAPALWIRPTPRDEPIAFATEDEVRDAVRDARIPRTATASRDGDRYAPLASLLELPPPARPRAAPPVRPRPTARTAPLTTAGPLPPESPHAPLRITGDLHAVGSDDAPTSPNATVLLDQEAARHVRAARSPIGDHGTPPRTLRPGAPVPSSPGPPPPQPRPPSQHVAGPHRALHVDAPPVGATPAPPPKAPPQRITARRDATPARDTYSLGDPAPHDSDRWSIGAATPDPLALDDDPLAQWEQQQLRRAGRWSRLLLSAVLLGGGILVGIAFAAPERFHRVGVRLGLVDAPTAEAPADDPSEASPPGAEPAEVLPAGATPEGSADPAEGSAEASPTPGASTSEPANPAATEAPDVSDAERTAASAAQAPAATERAEAPSRRDRTSPAERLRQGQDALNAGRLDEALSHFSDAADRGGTVEAHTGVADTYASMGRYDLALARYDRATRVGPRHQPAWFGLARMQERAGQRDEAIRSYERVVAIRDQGRLAHNATTALARLGAR